MTEASRVQKLLNEQNAEIDRLNFQIQVIQGAAAHAQKSYEQHLAVYRQKLEEKPPIWYDDIQSLRERDSIMTNRIEELEAALRSVPKIVEFGFEHYKGCVDIKITREVKLFVQKALEGKDD